jgi:putative pyruvate formate lyase activating enzyme
MIDNTNYEKCTLCPRNCGVNRNSGQRGVCGQTAVVKLARAALHYWEEPCISGTRGSGAVFFCGCSLHCVFCQNQPIASGTAGKEIPDERLAEIFLELQEQGANNINLVTPGHFVPQIIRAVERARSEGLLLPIVYNTGSYECVDTIRALEGIVDVYLPDFKYMDAGLAEKYSHAKDYPETAKAAIDEMVRQQPKALFAWEGGQIPIMKKGVIVRHLLLPGMLHDSRQILKYLYGRYGNQIYYSLMSQYTPLAHVQGFPELDRRVSEEAYENLVSYAGQLGITNGFTQEREVANETFIPYFDGKGV